MAETTIIVALDFPSKTEAFAFLDKFHEPIYVKVGMELFYKEGPEIIKNIKERGHKIFLDLKLHDIPNTVKSAMRNLASLDVDMVNVHAAGGKKMMSAAIEGLEEGCKGTRPLCIAVTQLTSTSPEMLKEELLIETELAATAAHYAYMAKEAGLDGVVCSVHESRKIHEVCGEDFLTVTPGIRPAGTSKDDQVRIATPAYAKDQGSNFIVVGRPITQAPDSVEAYKSIKAELK
ncbi:MAG: orotidine-5'-phosphate decarboxylase [Firmicutes bacterium]|nr:orotidine-5'-phosphate decarboxylase [Bacillota bacterium]MBQ4340148.1 orotidine-5'-phosphate decarboxylase [Bacillota bacterium]